MARDYQSVVSAQIDQQSTIIRAEAYRIKSIPRATIEAREQRVDAQKEAMERISKAKGRHRPSRFVRNRVPRRSLYLFQRRLDVLKKNLKGRRMTIIDHELEKDVMDRRLNLLRIILGLTTLCVIISSMSFMVRQGGRIRIRLGKVEQTCKSLVAFCPWPIEDRFVWIVKSEIFARKIQRCSPKTTVISFYELCLVVCGRSSAILSAVGTLEEGDAKLSGLITTLKISILGGYELSALASTDTSTPNIQRSNQRYRRPFLRLHKKNG